MSNKQYKLNPQTLAYEVVATPFKLRFYRFMRKLLIGFILASIVNLLFSYFFLTPKMYQISEDNSELVMKYAVLQNKIGAANKKLTEIKHRDNSVYRKLFAADTLSIDGVYDNYPARKYSHLKGDRYEKLMTNTWLHLDALTRVLYLESVSLDELQVLSLSKEELATAVPAIWPIDRNLMTNKHIGAYGMRLHPILRYYMLHKGIDLGARVGTPVYATGNAVVEDSGRNGAYGIQILIDHGFGYKTRYAHLSKSNVEQGQVVRRGELIGEVGNTGRSTGPHLHYEVIYMGQTVNPINYFRKDMDEAEFQRIVESARTTTYEGY